MKRALFLSFYLAAYVTITSLYVYVPLISHVLTNHPSSVCWKFVCKKTNIWRGILAKDKLTIRLFPLCKDTDHYHFTERNPNSPASSPAKTYYFNLQSFPRIRRGRGEEEETKALFKLMEKGQGRKTKKKKKILLKRVGEQCNIIKSNASRLFTKETYW